MASKATKSVLAYMYELDKNLDALEDSPDHDVKVWMQGHHDCLKELIKALEELL